MLSVSEKGLYCAAGDFYIDPCRSVERAVITHAHSDHARPGSRNYLTSKEGGDVLRHRVGQDASIQTVAFGDPLNLNGVRVSLHPAGHVLGSAQVRVEQGGQVWVVSGDYKLQPDPTCTGFEPVCCHTFISECTFGLPIYRWEPPESVFEQINSWWSANQKGGLTSVLLGYSLGKAQRLLAGVDPSIGPILVHASIHAFLPAYEAAGMRLPSSQLLTPLTASAGSRKALIIVPPSALAGSWREGLGAISTAVASGWMQVRSRRRGREADCGFVLSDHADWPGLLSAIQATRAHRVLLTHGATGPMVRWLNESGLQAEALESSLKGASKSA